MPMLIVLVGDPATLGVTKSLDYDPHPCGSPFGSGIACLNSFQTNLSRHKHSGMMKFLFRTVVKIYI